MTARVYTWDHNQQPPLDGIADLIDQLTDGKITMRELDTGSDQYAWLITDKALRPRELAALALAEGIVLP